jgi:hypothetical protein
MTFATTFRERDVWVRDVCADGNLTAATRLVGVRLGFFLNTKTGLCDGPGYDKLAAAVGLKRRFVIEAIGALKRAGLIEGAPTRGWHANTFRLVMRTAETVHVRAPFEAETVHVRAPLNSAPACTIYEGDDATSDAQTVHVDCTNGAQACTQQEERERKNLRLGQNGSTGTVPVAPKRVAEREIGKAFEEWWSTYPRKEAKKAARVAYGRVLRKGEATIVELLAGVTRYAAACAGKERRYIKLPAGWLNDGRWADEGESTAAITKPILWPELVAMYARHHEWPSSIGPKPSQPGCLAPPDVLHLHGFPSTDDKD